MTVMMAQPTLSKRRVLLTTVSSDSHTWNLVFLNLLLEEHGNEVLNLGPCVPDAIVLEAVRQYRPDAIVVSSVNGHGFLDGGRLIRILRNDPCGREVPAVIGGKPGILGEGNDRYRDELLMAGFDAVFADTSSPDALTSYLRSLPGQSSLAGRKLDMPQGCQAPC
jgi:methylmalonyl-CoA mutase cobalamin-binding subunit